MPREGSLLERAYRPVRGALFERRWALALLDQSLPQIMAGSAPSGTLLEPASPSLYWADPFPIGPREDCLLFVEEFDRWRGLGYIVAVRVVEGRIRSRRTVLVDAHHVSFPQAQPYEGEWIATVQTCNPRAPIYRFRFPGDAWRPTEWALPRSLLDPALSRAQDGSWRLTGTHPAAQGVVLSYASTSEQPTDWTLIDQMSAGPCARGGGSLDLPRALRAAQDADPTYGSAVSLTSWPRGAEVRRLEGRQWAGVGTPWTGCHTLAWTPDGRTVVMDLWKRRMQPLSAVHRALEFRSDPCRGQPG